MSWRTKTVQRLKPSERPKCVMCGKPLIATYGGRWVDVDPVLCPQGERQHYVEDGSIVWFGHPSTQNLFCTLRCAVDWACYALRKDARQRLAWLQKYNEEHKRKTTV